MNKLSEYDYTLPEELIAQTPNQKRSNSRLLTIKKNTLELDHVRFSDLPSLLEPTDILVLNDTKVLKARLFGTKPSGGKVEVFLLHPMENPYEWTVLLKPAKRIKEFETITFGQHFKGIVTKKHSEDGKHLMTLEADDIYKAIETHGNIPLPPYIKSSQTKEANNYEKNYQTVFAKNPGAVAAPTAGLHMTEDIMEKCKAKGIQIEKITLHVGLGTFQPITEKNIQNHTMHKEWYSISKKTAETLTKARSDNQRIIAVGTTALRALESASSNTGVSAGSRWTDIYIKPGYTFKTVTGLITNFHLPKSSLIVLVSTLAGYDTIMHAYKTAIENRYRFYSFGDAMVILP